MPPLASLVVTTYNRRALLARCLAALLDQDTEESHEVLVIDDGSTDGTEAMVAQLADYHPQLRYHRHPNQGRARTRNRGLELAAGELLIFVDSDVIVVPGFLAAHLAAHHGFQAHHGHDMAFCQGVSLNIADLKAIGTPLPRFDLSQAFFDTKNVSIPRHHLLAAGGFETGFSEYGWEDLELGIRLKHQGIRRMRSSRAAGYHYHPPVSIAQLPELRRIEEQRGRMAARFYHLHPTWEVRLMIQHTPLHRLLNHLLTWGGKLDERSAAPCLAWLERRGHQGLATLLAQLILNQYNLAELDRSL